MFKKLVFVAILAGFGAGVASALMHFAFAQPLLLLGEIYETGALVHPAAEIPEVSVWGEWQRNGLTAVFTVLIYAGYALLLSAIAALAVRRGYQLAARTGLMWGLAGFVAIQLAPAVGMPPELPGASAALIDDRQVWWFGTIAVTATGLWLLAFGRSSVMISGAIVLMLVPHLIGAPEPDAYFGSAPPELASHFAARVLAIGMASWAVMGALMGYFWQQIEE